MNLLLDTHIFIWFDIDPNKLSPAARAALNDNNNQLFLSLASVLEMQIKANTGKLVFPVPLPQMISQQQNNNVQILPIELAHIYELENLPFHHKDPFDRLLIAQAKVEDFTLVTADPHFSQYPVKIL